MVQTRLINKAVASSPIRFPNGFSTPSGYNGAIEQRKHPEVSSVEIAWVEAKEVLNKFTSDVDTKIQKFFLSKTKD